MERNDGLTNGMKTLLLVLEEIFTIGMCVCLVLCVIFVGQTTLADQLFQKSLKYEDSSIFTNLVQDKLSQTVAYTKLCSNFEVRGEYDGKKIVDIAEYDKDDFISGKQTESVGYYLEDLIKWSQVGLSYDYRNLHDMGEFGVEFQGRQESGVEAVEYSEAIVEDYDSISSYILEENDETASYIYLEEKYLPVRGRHLFDYVSDDLNESDLLNHLSRTLEKIGEEYQQYKQMKTSMKEQKTNFRYYIVDYKNNVYYTNIENRDFMENSTIKTYGRYIILDSVNLEYESNLSVESTYLYSLLSKYAVEYAGDYYIEAAVDTEYGVIDSITENRDYYYDFLPGVKGLLAGSIFCAIITLIFLIILTIYAGKPNGFDKIKTEIAAGGLIFIGIILLYITAYGINYYRNTVWISGVIAGIGAAVINPFFLLGYFSLIRRIKAGILWSNSVCGWVCSRIAAIGDACGTIFRSRSVAFKTMVTVGSVFAVNWFLISNGAHINGFDILEFLAVCFDGFVLVLAIYNAISRNKILQGIRTISGGELEYQINTAKMSGDNLELANAVNSMGEGLHSAVENSIKNERLKADLITNVSHDIKTPLTSIINYVDLLKREDITNDKVKNYIEILDNKSQRLKHLTEDLVEASKISSGNIILNIERINFIELIHQTAGEFSEKFELRNLTLITSLPDQPVTIAADGRRLYRVLENLYNNVAKYAMENTRVYADLSVEEDSVEFSIKNISSQALNINASELTERFIRGDVSRSTEGSGLGLSIAKNLTEAMNGTFTVYLDGDLFKIILSFKKLPQVYNIEET